MKELFHFSREMIKIKSLEFFENFGGSGIKKCVTTLYDCMEKSRWYASQLWKFPLTYEEIQTFTRLRGNYETFLSEYIDSLDTIKRVTENIKIEEKILLSLEHSLEKEFHSKNEINEISFRKEVIRALHKQHRRESKKCDTLRNLFYSRSTIFNFTSNSISLMNSVGWYINLTQTIARISQLIDWCEKSNFSLTSELKDLFNVEIESFNQMLDSFDKNSLDNKELCFYPSPSKVEKIT